MLRPLRLVDDKRSGRDDGFRFAQPILRGTRGSGLAAILDPDFDLTLTYEAAARPANLGTKVAICRASRVPQGTFDVRATHRAPRRISKGETDAHQESAACQRRRSGDGPFVPHAQG